MEKKSTSINNRVIVGQIPSASKVTTPKTDVKATEKPTAPETTKTDPAKLLESEREKFEKLRAHIKEQEQKIALLEALETNISALESLQQENEECPEDLMNLFGDKDENFQLTLYSKKPGYQRSVHFKLNNPTLISEVIDLLLGKLVLRTEQLRADIIAQ